MQIKVVYGNTNPASGSLDRPYPAGGKRFDRQPALLHGHSRHHLTFQAKDRATVDRFYQAALANGGKDNGAPSERNYHPGYYAAFVLDPDGNNIEAVYHGEAKRSVGSVLARRQSTNAWGYHGIMG